MKVTDKSTEEIANEEKNFDKVYDLAQRESKTDLIKAIQNEGLQINGVKPFKTSSCLPVKMSPIFVLAWEGKDAAVKLLLEQKADSAHALYGYAYAGNMTKITEYFIIPRVEHTFGVFHATMNFLALGKHWEKAFIFLNRYKSEEFLRSALIDSFAAAVSLAGLVTKRAVALQWLLECRPFVRNPWFTTLLDRFNNNAYVSDFEMKSLQPLAEQYAYNYGPEAIKAVPWASLHVWFWQAPRLMTVAVGGLENPGILPENRQRQPHKLPTAIFMLVASFLGVDPKNADFYMKAMPVAHTQQLFFTSLLAIQKSRFDSADGFRELEQKTRANRLVKQFTGRTQSWLPALQAELASQSFFYDPDEEKTQVTTTVERCYTRLQSYGVQGTAIGPKLNPFN